MSGRVLLWRNAELGHFGAQQVDSDPIKAEAQIRRLIAGFSQERLNGLEWLVVEGELRSARWPSEGASASSPPVATATDEQHDEQQDQANNHGDLEHEVDSQGNQGEKQDSCEGEHGP